LKKSLWIFIGCGLLAAAASVALAEGRDVLKPTRDRLHRQMIDSARAEQQRLQGSGLLYRNAALEQYLNEIAGALTAQAAGSAEGTRVQVIREPYLNAYTLPGGFCFVSTGMLVRIENEAQLAAMLAHEMAHILRRHALRGIRHLHSESREHPAQSSAFGYRLEAEIEADRDSLQMMVRAGYDPQEAIRLYEHLQEELRLEKAEEPLFGRSHPRLSRRIAFFREAIARLPDQRTDGVTRHDRYRRQVLPVMADNAEMDIGIGRFLQAQRTLARYLQSVPRDPRAHFLMGEIHRQRGRTEEVILARACYRKAIELDAGYAAPHRALGLICYKAGESAAARQHLEASLALAPEGVDNPYIRHYLDRLSR